MEPKKKKIGLCISFLGTSYGMLLQAYATQYIIEKLGYNTEIIKFKSTIKRKIPFKIGTLTYFINRVIHRFRRKINHEILDEIHQQNEDLRLKVANEFRNNKLHNIITVKGDNELYKIGYKYDAVLVGSDQVWLPSNLFSAYFSLRFVPNNILKISYASSLGVSHYPWYYHAIAKDSWKRFDHISVREKEGGQIIKKICNNKVTVEVVADPTYLITKKEWEEIFPTEIIEKEKYVLCFILGNSTEQQLYVKNYAKANNLKLVSILSNESISDIDTTFADRTIIGANHSELINLIRGAEIIFTDSFHGVAFSVINEKQFYVFYRKHDDAKGKKNRNSRINNILRTWQIENRLISDLNYSIDYSNTIDYNIVTNLVMEFRKKSLEYLTKALPK